MKLQRTTIFLVVTACALSGYVYYSEASGRQREAEQTEQQRLFSLEERQIQTLAIAKPDAETLEFTRTDSEDRPWQMQAPQEHPADPAAVSFALNQITRTEGDRSFPVERDRLADFGLDTPQARITFQTDAGVSHELVLGTASFDGQSLYALVDPESEPPATVEVRLVPVELRAVLERAIEDWLAPETEEAEAADPETSDTEAAEDTTSETETEETSLPDDLQDDLEAEEVTPDPQPDESEDAEAEPDAPTAEAETPES